MKRIMDDLTGQRQKIFRMHMDVTEDRVLELSQEYESDQNALSQLMEHVLPYITIQREKESFCKVFQKERLLEDFERGQYHSRFQFFMEMGGVKYLCEMVLELMRNPANGHVECLVCGDDNTIIYLDQLISKAAVQESYKAIGIIYLKQNTIFFRSNHLSETIFQKEKELDYPWAMQKLKDEWVEEEEREMFEHHTHLDYIKSKIPQAGHFSFVLYNGRHEIERYSYSWLDQDHHFLLFVMEDLTREMETDYLTGYPNRKGFYHSVEQLISGNMQESYAILYINVMHFKAVNDRVGQEKADRLLRKLILRLRDSQLKPVVLARLESDHFGLLVKKKNLKFEQLPELLHIPFEVDGKSLEVYCRCGIYEIPENQERKQISVAEMTTLAKLSKKFIVNDRIRPYSVFTEQMRKDYVKESEVLSAFEQALRNGEFCTWFQPIIRAADDQMEMAEALVRWQRSDGSFVSPAAFVPVLEKHGYITKLDVQVSQMVMQMQKERCERGKRIIPISVNMSRMDLMDGELLHYMKTELNQDQRYASYMKLEITESAYKEITTEAQEALSCMRSRGIEIWVDDFGSGVSSFSTLMDNEFDLIKMDMEFVRRIGNDKKADQIVITIIDMAHRLGMKVIAEGIETKEQAEFLKKNDCDYFQGYYYAKPMAQSDFEKLLDKQGVCNG